LKIPIDKQGLCLYAISTMKLKAGKYMILGNPNSLFGPAQRYADTLKNLKLKAWEKLELKLGTNALFAVRNTKIVRINLNGTNYFNETNY